MKKCKHYRKRRVGDSYRTHSVGGGPVDIYWCPKCGALGQKLLGQQRIVWKLPEQVEQAYIFYQR